MTEGSDGMAYSDLIHGRDTTLEGRVEWICPCADAEDRFPNASNSESGDEPLRDSPDNREERANYEEVNLIARRIRSIVLDPEYEVEDKAAPRRARYEDIAILLRSRTHLSLLERALREANVPYGVAKGTGFYVQPEILNILSYVTFLTNPANDIALAAILRAPYFALSDVELFQVAHHESFRRRRTQTRWSFWDQFQDYGAHSGLPHLEHALSQLRENLALAGRTSAAQLVEKIYSETGIMAALVADPQSAQRIANLDKFLALARTTDASGFNGLIDFVERMQYLKESDERESQAELPDAIGLVRIMTVHEAKGLKFPIVILPFLQKKFRFEYTHLLDKELGLQITLPDGRDSSIVSTVISLRAKHAVIAEEKRIFYVAATRARDHLILSSTISENVEPHSWLS